MTDSPDTVTVFSEHFAPTKIVSTETQVADGVLRLFDGKFPVAMFAPGHWTHFLTSHVRIVPSANRAPTDG